MILPSFILPEQVNATFTTSGMDSIDKCKDKDYFLSYPHSITYNHNSRGYRDEEWPEDLSNAVWCLGDSFTYGLGSPLEHTWPFILKQKIKQPVINISMDGASNRWIARKAIEVCETIQPKNIILMWSYFHRREKEFTHLTDIQRRLHFEPTTNSDDIIDFKICLNNTIKKSKNTNLIHFIIPDAWPKQDELYQMPTIKNYLGEVKILDYARDKHHFDVLTSQNIVEKIIPLLTT